MEEGYAPRAMVARVFIASLVTVFAMVVALTAVISIRQYGSPTDFVGVVVLIAAWFIAAGVIARARRRRIRTGPSA
jgi:small-conductance mechanosensitive channel